MVPHGQYHLCVFCCHSQKRRNPHPKHRSGSAQRNGACHTGDVSGPHSTCQSRTDRLEGGTSCSAEAAAHLAYRCSQLSHLYKSGANTQKQSNRQKSNDGRRTPHNCSQFFHAHPPSGRVYVRGPYKIPCVRSIAYTGYIGYFISKNLPAHAPAAAPETQVLPVLPEFDPASVYLQPAPCDSGNHR